MGRVARGKSLMHRAAVLFLGLSPRHIVELMEEQVLGRDGAWGEVKD